MAFSISNCLHRYFSCHALCKVVIAPVFDTRKIVIGAVGINGVEIVIDGNIADTVLRKGEIGVKSCQSGISTQSG